MSFATPALQIAPAQWQTLSASVSARFRVTLLARLQENQPEWLAAESPEIREGYVRHAIIYLETLRIDGETEVSQILEACAAQQVPWPWPAHIREVLAEDGRTATDRSVAFVHEAALGTHRLTVQAARVILAEEGLEMRP